MDCQLFIMNQTESDAPFSIRFLTESPDLQAVYDLQRIYWGDNPEDNIPLHMLKSILMSGGHILGAFLDTAPDRLVGAAIGFPGLLSADDPTISSGRGSAKSASPAARLFVMSKRLVVAPQVQGHGVGEALKRFQFEVAAGQGYSFVSWTYDPTLTRNAHLNLHKLGGQLVRYIPEYFDVDSANPVLRADRVEVRAYLGKEPSAVRTGTQSGTPGTARYSFDASPAMLPTAEVPVINQAIADVLSRPMDDTAVENHPLRIDINMPSHVRLAVPAHDAVWQDAVRGPVWRSHLRDAMLKLLAAGYRGVDFVRGEPVAWYVFDRDADSASSAASGRPEPFR